jgi:hypothetical protein
MAWGGRLRPCGALALALALTACSSGPGEGESAPDRPQPSTTTTAGEFDLQDDVVLAEPQPGGGPSAGPSTTIARGKMAARSGVDGRDLPSAPGATATTAATTTTSLPPGLPAEKCPEPKTCRYYTFYSDPPYRWPVGPDGRATVEYWVNPSGAPSSITPEEVEGAVAAAFATWERAAPTLRFVYKGRTDRHAVIHDGMNVVAFDGERAQAWPSPGEFDIQFPPTTRWVWAPCEQRDGACTPYSPPTEVGTTNVYTEFDLQSTATHEVGHVLWLDHPPAEPAYRELTMQSGSKDRRSMSTLALGDVLGVRALYPCSCPLPPIYDP